MDSDRFHRLVARALRSLPSEFRRRLANVAIVVEEEPNPEDIARLGLPPGETVFGLYLGIPLTERSSGYGMVLPDRIAIYRRPLEEACRTERDLIREIRRTLAHELAHHFGLTDEDLRIPSRRRRRAMGWIRFSGRRQ